MSDFDDFQTQDQSYSPPWLSGLLGTAWSLVLGITKQAVFEAAKEAALVSFPSYAPPDALSELAKQRDLIFGFGEDVRRQRERLRQGWRLHRLTGFHGALVLGLQQMGYTNVSVEDHGDDLLLPEWHFRVVLNRPFPFDDQHLADEVWSPPTNIGTWRDGGVWAGAMPFDHLVMIRALVRKHKSSESRCAAIRVIYDPSNPLDVAELDP